MYEQIIDEFESDFISQCSIIIGTWRIDVDAIKEKTEEESSLLYKC